jgi:hypothetical protein
MHSQAKVVSLGLNAEHSSTHLVSSMAASLVVVLGVCVSVWPRPGGALPYSLFLALGVG